jgi:DNA-binding NarL/FixJ family response regulator
MIRLLIADDHAIMRGGLKQIFAPEPDMAVVGEACDGAEVMNLLRQAPVDLLLLDLNMPGIKGPDLVQRIKVHHPSLKILMLSMHKEPQFTARMLKAGVQGYITKDCEPDILLAAIRKVAAGGRYIDPDLAEMIVFTDPSSGQHPTHGLLSNREAQVLRLLATGKGVNEIGRELAISSKTVSTHKARLLEKLELTSMADLMRYAIEHQLLD